ncbi:hypothetical protein PIB30_028981 [Stylosanthes scabra]|uniref:Uncharacterized protein n=1 Tax=Stylosanthes scabra TaxID=79078 RepID=A0ABU6VCI4_9FABA|nr:hypothetical protein [Stylosanthes scabra]
MNPRRNHSRLRARPCLPQTFTDSAIFHFPVASTATHLYLSVLLSLSPLAKTLAHVHQRRNSSRSSPLELRACRRKIAIARFVPLGISTIGSRCSPWRGVKRKLWLKAICFCSYGQIFVGAKKPDVKKEPGLGLTNRKAENFGEWYSKVVVNAEMIEYYDVYGCYILRPWAMKIWEIMRGLIDLEIKKMKIKNCYFPLFVYWNFGKGEGAR